MFICRGEIMNNSKCNICIYQKLEYNKNIISNDFWTYSCVKNNKCISEICSSCAEFEEIIKQCTICNAAVPIRKRIKGCYCSHICLEKDVDIIKGALTRLHGQLALEKNKLKNEKCSPIKHSFINNNIQALYRYIEHNERLLESIKIE
ncbi:hypothetical protein COI92_06850 [Bacillus anthracis]|nr:hypothetical protein COI92_06850 [Bacillus anthracis]